jgi:hypothetical protein
MQYPLNHKYFHTLHHETQCGSGYFIVQPRGRPMVLFSREGDTPLVAITLRLQDSNRRRSPCEIVSKSPTKFQGSIRDSRQRYELILTNLTDLGEIKIDILSRNSTVRTVDPGAAEGSINRVNELNPFQSYPVRTNQKNLRYLTLTESTDYYISVTPRSDILELLKKFQDTYWDCVDFICIRTTREKIAEIHNREYTNEEVSTGLEYEYNVSTNLEGGLCHLALGVGKVSPAAKMNKMDIINVGKMIVEDHCRARILREGVFSVEECVICLDDHQPPEVVILPCRHRCAHRRCLQDLPNCPVCRTDIEKLLLWHISE